MRRRNGWADNEEESKIWGEGKGNGERKKKGLWGWAS